MKEGQAGAGGLAAAWAVHAFTGFGSVCALLAMLAVLDGRFEAAFAWLFVALAVDGVDGTLARAIAIEQRLPRFSGERLDLVIDYVTYVFIPVLALLKGGFLPGVLGVGVAALILLSSLYHFADTESKTDDNCFVGFPAVWNIVAFCYFAWGLPAWLATSISIVLSGLATGLWILWQGFPGSPIPAAILAACALYYVALALIWPRAR